MSIEYDQSFEYSGQFHRGRYEDTEALDYWKTGARHSLAISVIDRDMLPIELPVMTLEFYGRDPQSSSPFVDMSRPIPNSMIEQGHPWEIVIVTYRVRCRRPVTS